MSKFYNYLEERKGLHMRPKAGSQYGHGITFIDIDETVFNTFAKIKVIDKETGKVKRELDNQEYNSDVLGPGEKYDYGQFRDAEFFLKTSKPIPRMVKRINRMIQKIQGTERGSGSRIVFLTARSDFDDKNKVIQTFEKYGIKIDKPTTYIERSGNIAAAAMAAGKSISTEEAKKKVMLKYLKTGDFRRVRLIDDYEPNLRALLEIEKNLPKDIEKKIREKWNVPPDEPAIEVYALHMQPDGSLKRVKM